MCIRDSPQNAIWSPQGGGLFEATIASIPMNSCVTLPMFTRILTNNGPWDNHAEIVSATTPNGTPILEALDNSSFVNNLDVVAIVPMNPVGVIGSCVFKDVNGNGVKDLGEPGVANIGVQLFSGNGTLIESTFSDTLGNYMFVDLFAGSYFVKFNLANDYVFTDANQGNNDNLDSDVDNSNGPGTTTMITLGVNEVDMSICAGLYRCIPFGDFVWLDVNGNNMQDPNENGINGLSVKIFRRENGVWSVFRTVFTGHRPGTPSDDGYWKTCLPPGEYYVDFNAPSQLRPAVPLIGGISVDSDIMGAFGTHTTNIITLESCTVNCDIDAGYTFINSQPISNNDPFVLDFNDEESVGLTTEGSNLGKKNLITWSSKVTDVSRVSHYKVDKISTDEQVTTIATVLATETNEEYSFIDYQVEDNGEYTYKIYEISRTENVLASSEVIIPVNHGRVDLNLYPNPVSDHLVIEVDLDYDVQELFINMYDSSGARVRNIAMIDVDLRKGIKTYNIDVSQFAPGLYYVLANFDGKEISRRIIIVK